MTGKINFLCTYQPHTLNSYEQNLSRFLEYLLDCPAQSLCLAPEVCCTGFDYDHFDTAATFSQQIDQALLEASHDKCIVLTMIEKVEDAFFNIAKVYDQGQVIHTQIKDKLFTIGDETRYFTPPATAPLRIFEVGRLRIAILICFELRFIELWEAIQGVDIVLIPARWGKIRSEHFITLSTALAIANQCYVLTSDTHDDDTTAQSAIITPMGTRYANGDAWMQRLPFKAQEIVKMRRYLNIGLPNG